MVGLRSARLFPVLMALAAAQAILLVLVVARLDFLLASAVLLAAPAAALVLPPALRQGWLRFRVLRSGLNWMHALLLLSFLSALVFRIRDAQAARAEPLDVWAFYRVGLMGIVALVLAVRLASGRTPWLFTLFRGLVGPMAVFSLVSLASTAWSVYPAWTLYKSAEFFVDVVLLAAILVHVRSTAHFKTLYDWMWVVCGAMLAAVWLGAVIWPAEALVRPVGLLGSQIQGVLPAFSANSVGGLGALLALVSLNRLLVVRPGAPGRAFYSLVLAASLATMLLAQTRSAIAGFVAGMAVLLFLAKRIGNIALVGMVVVVLLSQSGIAGTLQAYLMRGQDEADVRSLTGRMNWWNLAWDKFVQRPVTGYGAYAGGRFVALEESGFASTSSLHNTYLETILGTGFWGLVPLLAALGGVWTRLLGALRRVPDRSTEQLLLSEAGAVLALDTVGSFFSPSFIWHPALTFLLVLGYAEFLGRRSRPT